MAWAALLTELGAEELPLVPFGADAIQYLSPGLADPWRSQELAVWQEGWKGGALPSVLTSTQTAELMLLALTISLRGSNHPSSDLKGCRLCTLPLPLHPTPFLLLRAGNWTPGLVRPDKCSQDVTPSPPRQCSPCGPA